MVVMPVILFSLQLKKKNPLFFLEIIVFIGHWKLSSMLDLIDLTRCCKNGGGYFQASRPCHFAPITASGSDQQLLNGQTSCQRVFNRGFSDLRKDAMKNRMVANLRRWSGKRSKTGSSFKNVSSGDLGHLNKIVLSLSTQTSTWIERTRSRDVLSNQWRNSKKKK